MSILFKKTLGIPLTNGIEVSGDLTIPADAKGIVVFSHGSGSSRLSPRNRMVADYLVQQQFGTLLFDLLTPEEDRDYDNRFNIRLLTERLVAVSEWLYSFPQAKGYNQAYFGASTGAAAALYAAAVEGSEIAAVVSRGGRPDLAMEAFITLKAPTLLIVGGADTEVLHLNQKALDHMHCTKKLEIVAGATHLFEEKGTMEQVCVLAGTWLQQYLHPVRMIPD
ncbi:MAG TPA: alpha/beta fold hydrolase [Chitinophagaceae bacterium]